MRGSVSFDMCLDRAGRCSLEATEDGLLKMHGSLDSGAEGANNSRLYVQNINGGVIRE